MGRTSAYVTLPKCWKQTSMLLYSYIAFLADFVRPVSPRCIITWERMLKAFSDVRLANTVPTYVMDFGSETRVCILDL